MGRTPRAESSRSSGGHRKGSIVTFTLTRSLNLVRHYPNPRARADSEIGSISWQDSWSPGNAAYGKCSVIPPDLKSLEWGRCCSSGGALTRSRSGRGVLFYEATRRPCDRILEEKGASSRDGDSGRDQRLCPHGRPSNIACSRQQQAM